MRHVVLTLLAASTGLAGIATAATPKGTPGNPPSAAPVPPAGTPAKPQYGAFGFDEAGMDKSVKPGDDFYGFANGTWAKATKIPADRSNYGMFTALDDLSTTRSRAILDEVSKQPGSRIGDLYASFIDEAAAEKKGMAPIKPLLAAIQGVSDKSALAREMAELRKIGIDSGLGLYIGQDDKDPDSEIVGLSQSGLGLPDRDYYLKPDAEIAKTRAAYVTYLGQLLQLAGEPNGPARAQAIMEFETKLAAAHWTRIESRDATKTYNKWMRADFEAKAPGFDWKAYFGDAGVDARPAYLVAQPTAITGTARLIADTPLPVLKDWLEVKAIDGMAPYLSKPFVDTAFAFNQTTLSGTPENQPRWKRGVGLVKDAIGEDLGQVYVQRYFPPETKAAAEQLVKNIIAAMDQRLQRLEWMDPMTRVKARQKLAAFTPKIGYPSKWRNYSALKIDRADLVGNVEAANRFEWNRLLAKLDRPVDRTEWGMTPMEINAYANFNMNEIVFPAAILQPPFFDPHADPAINYGGIGAVIGHEMSHHFDDQGSKYDLHGRLTDWWAPQDVQRFQALTKRLADQYDQYEPLAGQHVQGQLTLGENIADLAGLTASFDAYKISLGGKPAPVIGGYTGEQRFYLGWAQVWRRNYREPNLRQRLLTDPHAPSEQRVATVRNLDPWYGAYQPAATDKLYLPVQGRVRIW